MRGGRKKKNLECMSEWSCVLGMLKAQISTSSERKNMMQVRDAEYIFQCIKRVRDSSGWWQFIDLALVTKH